MTWHVADVHCCVLTLLKDPPLQTMGAGTSPSHEQRQDVHEPGAFPGKSRSISTHLLTSTGPAPESNYEHIKGFPHEAFVWQDLSLGPVMTVGLAALHFIHLISLTPHFLQFWPSSYPHSYISLSSFFKHVMSSAAFMIYCLSSSLLIRSYRSASFPSANVQVEGGSYGY